MAPQFWVKGERSGQVDWSDSKLTDESLERKAADVLPKMFERMKTEDGTAECSLIISGNQLQGPDALASTLHMFRLNHVRVSSLRLHKNQLGDKAMQALVDHIVNAAEDGQPLMELHLSDNKISGEGIRSLVEAAHKAASSTGVYLGKREKRPDGRDDRRHNALWLRTENQKPPISDPQNLLEELEADGCPVCILPSKDWQPPSGKGKGAFPRADAAVHMHHSFVRRDRRANEEWEERENKGLEKEKGKSGWGEDREKGKNGWGDEKGKGARVEDWSKGKGSWHEEKGKGGWNEEKGKGKAGKSPDEDDEWYYRAESSKGGKPFDSKGAKGKGYPFDGKGEGKVDRRSERNDSWYSEMGWRGSWHAWEDWGYEDTWEDWDDWDGDDDRDTRRSRDDRYQKTDHDRRGRWDRDWRSQSDGASASPVRERPLRQGRKVNSQPAGEWQGPGVGKMQPGLIADIAGSPWLFAAAGGVYKKLQDCQKLDMLKLSLNPSTAPEDDWTRIAELGARRLAAACMQRSSVLVGSFVAKGGLRELNCTSVGEVGLAAVFRHLELHRLLPPDLRHDDRDDIKCASIVAAVYGELFDAPIEGESAARENARAVAEWALLDFVFLLGVTRISCGFTSRAEDGF